MGMKEHIEQVYAVYEHALADAEIFEKELGYTYEIKEEIRDNCRRVYRLILTLPTPMMG